ncbi:MAG: hypothetical protein JO297_00655 [Nitrososphaeraceae archaeon]|nr:hypothetical protein [Nitrososphaeraceae archaeon]
MKPDISIKYRVPNDILATILQAANAGNKSQETFLNHSLSLEYLRILNVQPGYSDPIDE